MTATRKDSKGPPDSTRHVYGPRPVGALMPGLTRAAFKARSPAAAAIMADWPLMVGPRLAVKTAPRRLQGGTLLIGCAGPVAMELQHVAGEIIQRINVAVGRDAVQRLRFVQDFTPDATQDVSLPQRATATPAAAIPGLEPGELHDALAALGAALRNARTRTKTRA